MNASTMRLLEVFKTEPTADTDSEDGKEVYVLLAARAAQIQGLERKIFAIFHRASCGESHRSSGDLEDTRMELIPSNTREVHTYRVERTACAPIPDGDADV